MILAPVISKDVKVRNIVSSEAEDGGTIDMVVEGEINEEDASDVETTKV